MKRLIICIALLLALPAHAFNPFVVSGGGGGGSVCGEAGDTTIIGGDTTTSSSFRASNSLYLVRAEAEYDCSIDELHLRTGTSWGAGEGVVVGIYNDAGTTLLAQSDEVNGDGVADIEAIALQSSVSLEQGTFYILLFHNEAPLIGYWGAAVAGNKTELLDRGSYSTTLPATINVSAMTDEFTGAIYGTNP